MKRKIRKINRAMSMMLVITMAFCLIGCGNTASPAVGEDVVSTESMDASDIADMLESGMTVDEVIDRVEEVKESESATTDKPAETASPTQAPASTPATTAKPTPEPTETPKPTPTPTPHVHEYKVESSTEATCATEGSVVKVCECGERQTENVPATGQHNWVEGFTVIHHEALGHVSVTETQVQVGVGETRHEYECSYCGFRADTPSGVVDHQKANMADGLAHAGARTIIHDYPGEPIYETQTQSVWVVDQEAWDEIVGSGTYTCTVCGATK